MKNVLIFIGGAVVGAGAMYVGLKNKFEQKAAEEVAEVREFYRDKETAAQELLEKEEKAADEKLKKGYVEQVKAVKYTKYSDKTNTSKSKKSKIYQIDEDQYGDGDYELLTLTYFTDGKVVDEMGNVVTDPEDMLGEDFAKVLDDAGMDSVYFRNDLQERDFEVLATDEVYVETE